jgi:hypothetical protein
VLDGVNKGTFLRENSTNRSPNKEPVRKCKAQKRPLELKHKPNKIFGCPQKANDSSYVKFLTYSFEKCDVYHKRYKKGWCKHSHKKIFKYRTI